MGPRAGLDTCGKSHPPPGFDPRTVQTVASRYADYANRPTQFVVPPQNSTAENEENQETVLSGQITGRNSNTGPTEYESGVMSTVQQGSLSRLHDNNGERRFHVH